MIERFVPGAGGVENVAWQVAHELARQGEDVTVLAREGPDEETATPPGAPKLGEGLRLERVPAPRFWQPLRVTLFSHRVARATADHRFDVVHGFARTRHQDLYRAGGGSHDDYLLRNHRGMGRALRYLSPRHRALLTLERGVFRDPGQRIQCSSRLVANALVQHQGVPWERILLLPNAVDAERFCDPEAVRSGARLRESLDAKTDRVWLLPGSGWRRKGLSSALEAIARLDDPALRLWVAGRDSPGPWQARVRALGLGDRVRFLGPRHDMPAVYQAVDGMLLPTRYDPFANVTLEAAAAGLPIITSAGNGAAEWLAEDIRVIERADDSAALAEAILHFQGPAERRAYGERAQRRARELDWTSHVSALREEYRRIALARSKPERT